MIPGRKAAEQARPCRGEGMLFRVSPCGMFLRFTKRRPSVCAGRWLPLRRAQVVRLRPHPPGFDPAFPPAPGYSAALWRPMSFAVVPPLRPGIPQIRADAGRGGGEAPLPGPSFLSPAIPRLPFLRPYSSFCVFLLCRPCVPLCGAGRREKGEGRPPGRAVGERAGAEVSFWLLTS